MKARAHVRGHKRALLVMKALLCFQDLAFAYSVMSALLHVHLQATRGHQIPYRWS